MSRPCTIEYWPSLQVQGNDDMRPSGTRYEPSDGTAIETQSPSCVPSTHECTWSMAALAADAADEAPRASMIAAPRLATVGMNVSRTQASSPTTSSAGRPPTVACERSGYWVAEWLPQMVRRAMSATFAPVFVASC